LEQIGTILRMLFARFYQPKNPWQAALN